MKEFKNITKNKKEKSVKIGHSVPSDAANIALFDHEQILASNSLFVIDVSENIPENKIEDSLQTKLMFANELGILEDENGNIKIPTNKVSISDKILSSQSTTQLVDPSLINQNDFMHYYYVSRYFIFAQRGYSVSDISEVTKENYFSLLNIKVLDQNNKEYVDQNTGRKKYKILLEPYINQSNILNTEIPYKIFVGLDSSDPVNLKLVYDKIEVNSSGETYNLHLNYTETINAVPLFEEVAEESLILDPNNIEQNKFSIKNYLKKYSEINQKNDIDTNGFQIFVPKKALSDNRTFEVFNWRLIARSRQSINLDIISDPEAIESFSGRQIKRLNVGVLYDSLDSTSNEVISPYVFYRLENSPFNFSKFEFVNPLSSISEKNKAEYWKVDIQNVDDLSSFDVLTFCPTKKISEKALRLIDNFVQKYNGTLIVDAGLYPQGTPFYRNDIKLSTSTTSVSSSSSFVYNTSSKILDENKNGGWNIEKEMFSKDTYGIYGLQNNVYQYIDSSIDSSKKILSINNNCAAALYDFVPNSDSLSQGNIVFTSFRFLHYCNAVYSAASEVDLQSKIDNSTGETAFDIGINPALSGMVEGPYKFLFNCVAFALYCKTQASRKIDTRSILYNYVGEWNSSWTMYSDAVEKDEVDQYFVNVSSDTTKIKLGRDLIPSYDSIFSYYKKILAESMPDDQRQKIAKIEPNDFDFYIEVTNSEVDLTNSTVISIESLTDENIPSSYFIKKIDDPLNKSYAYTDKYSPKIIIPPDFGPYSIRQAPSLKTSDTKTLNNSINPVSHFKSYPFELSTNYSYISAINKPVSFNGSLSVNLEFVYKGKSSEKISQKRIGSVVRNWQTKETTQTTKKVQTNIGAVVTGATVDAVLCSQIKSAVDKNLYNNLDSDQSYNNFIYTGDINLGNSTNLWSTAYSGKSYDYVKYLQVAMKSIGRYGGGNYEKWPVDGKYGSKTEEAIKNFQQAQKNQGNCLYVDGTVDSETKSLIAKRLKTLSIQDNASYNKWRGKAQDAGAKVLQYWDAAVNSASMVDDGVGTAYKKISFTGFEGPTTIKDVIYFKIPEGYDSILSVGIDFGKWADAKIIRYGYSDTDYSESKLTTTERLQKYKSSNVVDISPNVGTVEDVAAGVARINLNTGIGIKSEKCKYMYIVVSSNSKLKTINSIFGNYAEGFSIQKIFVSAKHADTAAAPIYQDITETTTKDINWAGTYEAVDGLNVAPEIESAEYFNGKLIKTFASNQLYLENGQLKSNTLNKRVYVRGTTDGYYQWNGSSWIKEVNAGVETITRNIEDCVITHTNEVFITAYATVSDTFSGLTPNKEIVRNYTLDQCRKTNLYFTSIKYTYIDGKEYNETLPTETWNLSSVTEFTTKTGLKISFNQPDGQPAIVSNSSVTITDLKSDVGVSVTSPSSVISILYGNINSNQKYTSITLGTSATYYTNSEIIKTNPVTINETQYVLIGLDKVPLDNRKSITVHDGVVLLANKNNYKPIGIPAYSEISIQNNSIPQGIDRDLRFGDVNVFNAWESDGSIYGFYDINQKEFLGNSIPYIEILNRGVDNIFLAVCAIDADGNTQNQIDYIGPKISTTFKPINIPIKKIYPVYSIKFGSNSRIRIGNMSLDFEKNQAWPLAITSGSFIKKIKLSSNIYTDWKSNYLNEDLICYYDTSYIPGVTWSKIFGRGYYEIKDENPIIVSEKSIKVRQAPFIVWAEPSNYDSSILRLIRPQFEIYVNKNLAATKPSEKIWERVPFSSVKDYNCNTGIIEFKTRLVPDESKNIKISYVTKNSDTHIYQVDGEEAPLNPLLNSSKIQNNKPLYVYILPTKIEKRENINSTFSKNAIVTEYTNSYPVKFTYNKDIFNKSSNSYDPFALLIGIIYYNRNNSPVKVYDTRLRGGGIAYQYDLKKALEYTSEAISYWDMYPSHGMAYPKGGYVIIKLPKEVKQNFIQVNEIYDIVYRNLTAGVSFEIQDMDGNPFGVI